MHLISSSSSFARCWGFFVCLYIYMYSHCGNPQTLSIRKQTGICQSPVHTDQADWSQRYYTQVYNAVHLGGGEKDFIHLVGESAKQCRVQTHAELWGNKPISTRKVSLFMDSLIPWVLLVGYKVLLLSAYFVTVSWRVSFWWSVPTTCLCMKNGYLIYERKASPLC